MNFHYSYTLKINKMVKVSEKNINEVAKCRITANSDYNPESANIIARHLLLNRLFKLSPSALFRNGYIQRFSYNCTQYSRSNLRKTGFFDADSIGSLRSSITSSINSLGSYVIYNLLYICILRCDNICRIAHFIHHLCHKGKTPHNINV